MTEHDRRQFVGDRQVEGPHSSMELAVQLQVPIDEVH
jgi:hypothetical protein